MFKAPKHSEVYYAMEGILESYMPIVEKTDYYIHALEKIREENKNNLDVHRIDKIAKLENELNEKQLQKDVILQFMECLKDVQDQDQLEIIKLYYVEGLRTCDIARKWDKDSRIVRRKREKAMSNLLKVYNKRGEEFGFK